MFELHHLTATEQADALRKRELQPIELVEHYLARIDRLDGELGAFATVTGDAARARALELAESDARASALWGLPLADKDLVRRAGVRTAFGSRAFADLVPDASDELAIAADAAGAVNLGKTSTPEFGLPATTEPLAGPVARNPWHTGLGAGGSSGGAAVAVSAGLLPVAIGSDGGGSVRIPAAATGLVGLKPSRGLVPSGSGLDKLAGLVVPGALARTVADAAMIVDALVEVGAPDTATRAPRWDGGALLNAAVRGEGRFQVAVSTESPWRHDYDIGVSPDALAVLESTVGLLDELGHGVDELPTDASPEYASAFRTIWQVSAATIPLDDAQLDLVEPLTRWLVEQGRAISARQLAEALATLAAFERRTIRRFAPFDAVLTPALAMTPRPLGWYDDRDGERNFAQQVQYTPFTSFVNVAGLPAITLPVGASSDGLPMGVQLIGRPGGEHVLLAIGAQLERRLRWHRRHPPVW